MIGIDTSAIIDLFRGNREIAALLEKIEDSVVLNQISYLELMFGLDFVNNSRKAEEEFYDRLFSTYPTLDLNNQSCKEASKVFMALRKGGKTIDAFDCAIAGILLCNGVNKIISRNVKHLSNVPGLEVLKY